MDNFPNKKEIGLMIKNDMKIHRVRSCNFDEFLSIPNIYTHIIVGLAEMNSNCMMFGGKESDSFKIKYKNFDKFAKRAI